MCDFHSTLTRRAAASELPLRQQALQLRDAVLRVDEEVRFDVLPRLDLLAELEQLLRG